MKDIAIYGAGGFGREIACLIRIINESEKEIKWNLIGFFDDDPALKGQKISHYGICLGGMKELNEYQGELALTISIGSPLVVREIAQKITNHNVYFPNIIIGRCGIRMISPKNFFASGQSFSIVL